MKPSHAAMANSHATDSCLMKTTQQAKEKYLSGRGEKRSRYNWLNPITVAELLYVVAILHPLLVKVCIPTSFFRVMNLLSEVLLGFRLKYSTALELLYIVIRDIRNSCALLYKWGDPFLYLN